MPKFLAGKVVVRIFETYADSPEQAESHILKWQESGAEEPEGGIKATSFRLMWHEFDCANPTEARNLVLAQFLNLMQNQIPGMPEASRIIHPFTLEVVGGKLEVVESQGEKGDGCNCGTKSGVHKQGCPASGGMPLVGERPMAT